MCSQVSVSAAISGSSRRMAQQALRHPTVMITHLLLVMCLIGPASSVANASPSREWLGARPVERPLVLPRGWTEAAVGWERHRATGSYGADGQPTQWQSPMRTRELTASVRIGVAPRVEVNALAGLARSAIEDQALAGLAVAEVGVRVRLLQQALPLSSLTTAVTYQLPVGLNVPARTQVASPSRSDLALGRGASAFRPALRLRRQYGALRLDAGVVGELVLPAFIQQGSTRVDWGDGVGLETGGLFQIGPVGFTATLTAVRWGDDRVGDVRVASAGWQVHVEGGGVISLNRSIDIVVVLHHGLRGRPTWFSGSPDLSATPGPRRSVSAVVRW